LPASINQQKFTYLPSADATKAARRILLSHGLTNTPTSLFRALPSYPLDPGSAAIRGKIDGADLEHDGEDSYIARVAQCIGSALSVWAVIKPGFVDWVVPVASGTTGNPKGKKRMRRMREELDGDELTTGDESVSAVGDEAWSMLEWLVLVIFDRDERRAVEDNQRKSHFYFDGPVEQFILACYSPLLLSSIPSTQNRHPRWDATGALDVVFCCLNEQSEERISIGITLLRQVYTAFICVLFIAFSHI
jgi:hypothetical protein